MRICLFCYRGNPYSGGQGVYLYHLTIFDIIPAGG